ncbi:MAG: DUF2726 domain-containing protein [Pseudomonadota bacterium]
MNALIALVVLMVLAFVIFQALKNQSAGSEGDWPLYAKRPMSMREHELYWKLLKALPDHIVLSQVALSQIVGVKKGHKALPLRNRYDRKVADFVVCAKDASVLAVIELDDATHEREDRKNADAVKDKVLRCAGIKLIRWQAKSLPDFDKICLDIFGQPAMIAAPKA